MVTLYPHQVKALSKLRTGSVLVGGVGSGKSLTALAYFYNKVCGGDYETGSLPISPRPLYIITTARKRDTLEWDLELTKFGLSTNPDASVLKTKVVIDSWNNIKKYTDISNAFFIFDEQRVVGSGAWVKAFLAITKSNDWILLSATPGDVWADYIPVFVANRFYKNRTEFLKKHAVFSRYTNFPKIEKYVNTAVLEKYRKLILVVMEFERATVRNQIDVDVSFDVDLYTKVAKDRWNIVKDEPIRDAGELCHLLRNIVNTDISRYEALVRLTQFHDKIIVFYNLDSELEILRNLSEFSDQFAVAEWNGHRHDPIPSTDSWVYLVQYMAGAEGWNCIQTDTIVFYSLNYSYKMMEQAAGRIDRLNTPFKYLYYYRFVSKSSIDNAILSALKRKKTFNENTFAERSREIHVI